jgi:hypothetical protein
MIMKFAFSLFSSKVISAFVGTKAEQGLFACQLRQLEVHRVNRTRN